MNRFVHRPTCNLGPTQLEFCGPRSIEDTEACCKKIEKLEKANELKCLEEETKKWELNEAKKNAHVYDISNPYVKVTRRPIMKLRGPRLKEARKNAHVYDISNPYVKVTRRPILRLRRPRFG